MPSNDTLFEEVFGKKPAGMQESIAIQLEIDDERVAWGAVVVSAAGTRVLAAPLLQALAPRVREDVHAHLAAAVERDGRLALSALEETGLVAAYDPTRLVVRVAIAPHLRRLVVDTLGPRFGPENLVPASGVSAYLNLWMAQDFTWGAGQGASAREPFRLALESAVNLRGWALEARGEVSEAPQQPFSLRDVRLVKDDVAHALRLVAGDFRTPAAGLLRGQQLLGVGLARNFSLDRNRQVIPTESVEFLLERPSTVEVFVNGRAVQTLSLAAGTHDLRGLMLDGGANELELVITDDLGLERRIVKHVGLASGQLAAGVFEAAFGLGIPLRLGAQVRTYDWDRPTLCASYRRGITSALSLGGSIEASLTAQAAGVEALWSTFYGSIGGTAALSQQSGRAGFAAGLRYEFLRTASGRPLALGVGGEYRSLDFVLPGEPHPLRAATFLLSGSFGMGLAQGLNARLLMQLRSEPLRAAPALEGTLSVSKSFQNGLGLSLDLFTSHNPERAVLVRGRLNVVWAWPGERRSAQALTEIDQTGQLRARLTLNQEVNTHDLTFRASAGAALDARQRGTFEALAFRSQRFEASIRHVLSVPVVAGEQATNLLQTRLGTAIVFADGVFAWSRPVMNSFAIVRAIPALEGQRVEVNASTAGYAAAADALGPGVLQDLEPYATTRLRLGAPTLRVGSALGTDVYDLKPSYRSGTLIRVGEEGSVLLRGTLLDADGVPLALSTGVVTVADDRSKPLPFFTSRSGKFVVSGLTPGRYALSLDGLAPSVLFTIPDGQTGLFELGKIQNAAPIR